MHKSKNICFLLIKKRDGPRQEVAQSRVPSAIAKKKNDIGIA